MKKLLLILFLIFAFAQWSEAATRYANGSCSNNGDGTALTCAAGAGQPGAYNSATNAQTGATAGDTIIISGGSSGQSYTGLALTKQLTWTVTSQSGHNGPVTIAYSTGISSSFYNQVDGTILQGTQSQPIYLTGGSGGWTLRSTKNFVGSYLRVDAGTDSYPGYFGVATTTTLLDHCLFTRNTSATGKVVVVAGGALTANYCQFISNSIGTQGISTSGASSAITLNNSLVNTPFGYPIYVDNASASVSLVNTEVYPSVLGFLMVAGASITNSYSAVNSQFAYPDTFKGANGTWTAGTGTQTNIFPWHRSYGRGTGYITIMFDAWADIATYWRVKADYAMNTHSVFTSIDLPDTATIGAANKAQIQTLWKAGHGIGSHGRRSSQNANEARAMSVNPGVGEKIVTISGSGTLLDYTGQAQINLTSGSYDTMAEVETTLEGYGATVVLSISGSTPSTVLADGATVLPASTATYVPFDATRFFLDQVVASATDIETAMHEDPGCAAYLCKSMSWPGDAATTGILAVAPANMGSSLKALRWSTGYWQTIDHKGPSELADQYIYSASFCHDVSYIKGAGGDYAGLSTAQKQARIEQGARNLVLWAAQGYWITLLYHYNILTDTEFQWMLDEIMKYVGTYNVQVKNFDQVIDDILNSGNWSTIGNGHYTRTFTGTDDYHLVGVSPLINAGTNVSLTSDYYGIPVPIGSAPDIGISENLGSNALMFSM